MSEIKPRPALLTTYQALGLPKGQKVHRIELYRTKRRWYQLWKPKYDTHYLALTNNAIYDVTEFIK